MHFGMIQSSDDLVNINLIEVGIFNVVHQSMLFLNIFYLNAL